LNPTGLAKVYIETPRSSGVIDRLVRFQWQAAVGGREWVRRRHKGGVLKRRAGGIEIQGRDSNALLRESRREKTVRRRSAQQEILGQFVAHGELACGGTAVVAAIGVATRDSYEQSRCNLIVGIE
jgi:hypothetical protein